MNPPYIPATALGKDLVRGWTGPVIYGDIFPANTPVRWVVSAYGAGGMANGTNLNGIRLDPRHPEVAHRIADVLRARGHEVGHLLPVALGGRQGDVIALAEPTCTHPGCDEAAGHGGIHQMGNTRQIVTIPAADVSALTLAASVAGVEAGRGVVRGVLGGWRENHWTHYRDGLDGHQRVWTYIRAGDRAHDGDGWAIGRPTKATPKGPETGPEGRAAADAALLRLGYAYLDPASPFGVVVPTFDLENER